jgi:hypothetical protein
MLQLLLVVVKDCIMVVMVVMGMEAKVLVSRLVMVFAPLSACRRFDDDFAQPANHDDDGLGKPKFICTQVCWFY